MQAIINGSPVMAGRWTVGTMPDGTSWASFEMSATPKVSPHDRITIADDRGRSMWVGVAQRVTNRGGTQDVEVNDLTAIMLARRITPSGEYDPHFRFGDVITARGGNGRHLLVLATDEGGLNSVLMVEEQRVLRGQRLRPNEWEIVE